LQNFELHFVSFIIIYKYALQSLHIWRTDFFLP